jgi:hypothetical protein
LCGNKKKFLASVPWFPFVPWAIKMWDMRFSVTTVWLGLKIRLIVTGLIFAIGFYCGMVHKVLTQGFWPGSEALAGFVFFLGLGVFAGISLPALWGNAVPLLKPRFTDREFHPVSLARIILSLLSVAVLTALLFGALITQWLASVSYLLPERFILGPVSWRLLAFILPILSVGGIGVILGLILDLTFSVFIYLECPNHMRSEQPEVQKVISSVNAWTLLALGTAWPLGFYLTEIFIDRWFPLILVPTIWCLAVLLISLVEGSGESPWLDQLRTRGNILYNSFPEIAGHRSLWARSVVMVLGGLVVWNSIHWTYTLSNWYGSDRITTDQAIGLSLLAVIGAVSGIKLGSWAARRRSDRGLTISHFQGSAIASLGIAFMLAAVIINQIMKADRILTLYPQIVIPLLLITISVLWGATLGLTAPALSVGRPNRFDFWIELNGKMAVGAMVASPLFLVWQYWNLGNLLALSFASLLAIGLGGVAIIYEEPLQTTRRKKSRRAKYVHIFFILFLYLGLGFITFFVPHLKTSWLRPTETGTVFVGEGRAGVAYLIDNTQPKLVWSNRIVFPERTDPDLRNECTTIINQILKITAEERDAGFRSLLFNCPAVNNPGGFPVTQFDIDRALRKLELKFQGLETNSLADFSELYTCQRPYHLVVALLPSPWPKGQSWPNLFFLTRRLFALAQQPTGVWILSLEDEKSDSAPLLQPLKTYSSQDLQTLTLDSKSSPGHRWKIYSASPSLDKLIQ